MLVEHAITRAGRSNGPFHDSVMCVLCLECGWDETVPQDLLRCYRPSWSTKRARYQNMVPSVPRVGGTLRNSSSGLPLEFCGDADVVHNIYITLLSQIFWTPSSSASHTVLPLVSDNDDYPDCHSNPSPERASCPNSWSGRIDMSHSDSG